MSFPGTYEWIVIFLVVLIVFGPKSLPKFGRALGNGLREFRAATNKVTDAINTLDEEPESPKAKTASAPAITNVTPPQQVVQVDQVEVEVEPELLQESEETEKSEVTDEEKIEVSSSVKQKDSAGDDTV